MSLVLDRDFQSACSRAEDAAALAAFAAQNLADARMNLRLAELAAERAHQAAVSASAVREEMRARLFAQALS